MQLSDNVRSTKLCQTMAMETASYKNRLKSLDISKVNVEKMSERLSHAGSVNTGSVDEITLQAMLCCYFG